MRGCRGKQRGAEKANARRQRLHVREETKDGGNKGDNERRRGRRGKRKDLRVDETRKSGSDGPKLAQRSVERLRCAETRREGRGEKKEEEKEEESALLLERQIEFENSKKIREERDSGRRRIRRKTARKAARAADTARVSIGQEAAEQQRENRHTYDGESRKDRAREGGRRKRTRGRKREKMQNETRMKTLRRAEKADSVVYTHAV
ncbi:hypothetical protein TGFOU_403780 [Toxoplasma gondii FOU]|uniref:Uncharacterized protein n=1 Tax=Toxoplasma gondii FOU TaxID=943167 RepID=A0A086L9W2_TOXGO|nr:hypothetical protein TGFOU_403780 [Toxoplasma gondii FOU]